MMDAACTGTGTGADMTSGLTGGGCAAGCSTGGGGACTIALAGAAMLSAPLVATATGSEDGIGMVDRPLATPTAVACTMPPTGASGAMEVGSSGAGGAGTTWTVVAW